jgi:DNA-directed RNA polymerase specialized sigma24 family protein
MTAGIIGKLPTREEWLAWQIEQAPSERAREVLLLFAKGLSLAEVAELLSIPQPTITALLDPLLTPPWSNAVV